MGGVGVAIWQRLGCLGLLLLSHIALGKSTTAAPAVLRIQERQTAQVGECSLLLERVWHDEIGCIPDPPAGATLRAACSADGTIKMMYVRANERIAVGRRSFSVSKIVYGAVGSGFLELAPIIEAARP